MKRLAYVLALAGYVRSCDYVASTPALRAGNLRSQMEASDAASQARIDMLEAFGARSLKPGSMSGVMSLRDGPQRVVVSLSDQLAYLYRGDTLVAVSTISSGKDEKPTPIGIFSVLDKKPMYRSKKYDNAPMPLDAAHRPVRGRASCRLQSGVPGQPRLRAAAKRFCQEALLGHGRRHAGLHRRVNCRAALRRAARLTSRSVLRCSKSKRGLELYRGETNVEHCQ